MKRVRVEEIEEAIAAGGDEPLLLGFGAPWSAPWKLLAKVLDEMEERGTKVVRVDVDTHPELADRYTVVSVPTFLVIVENREVRRYLGAVSPSELEAGTLHRSAKRGVARSGMRRRR